MIQQTKIACRQHKFKLSNSVYEDFLGSFQHLFTQGAGNTAVHWSHKLTEKGKLAKNSDIIIFLLVIHVYIKKYKLICSFTMVLEIMKRMITKLRQLYGVSHYLCMVSTLVWFNQPLLKLSNCAIHLQQCKQLLRISCKKKTLFTFTATGITLFIYLSIYSIHAKISKVVPYTDTFNINMQYCMHSVKHITKKIIM
jgi:hypothetical protein